MSDNQTVNTIPLFEYARSPPSPSSFMHVQLGSFVPDVLINTICPFNEQSSFWVSERENPLLFFFVKGIDPMLRGSVRSFHTFSLHPEIGVQRFIGDD